MSRQSAIAPEDLHRVVLDSSRVVVVAEAEAEAEAEGAWGVANRRFLCCCCKACLAWLCSRTPEF